MNKVVKAGDKLVDGSQPFVIQVEDTDRETRCHYCLNRCDSLKKCGQCHQVQYCSKACQAADWKDIHKHNECKLLKNTRECSYNDKWRFFVRLVLKVTFDPQSRQRLYPLWDGRQRKFEDLISHEDKILPDNNVGLMAKSWLLINKLDELFAVKLTISELWRWWGMLKINCMEVGNREWMRILIEDNCDHVYMATPAFSTGNENYASALYIDGSALDHDCRPSCVRWFNGRRLQVRAMRTIDLSAEQPTTPYADWRKDRDYRRKLLSERYFFECQCRRCAEHTDRDFDFNRYQNLLDNQKDLSVDYWEEVIAKERALVGPHYPNITNGLFMKFAAIGQSLGNGSSRPLLKKWYALAKELKQEFEITHGVDHPDYYKIMANVRQAEQMCALMRF